jgi:biotin carboxyl carrier protein
MEKETSKWITLNRAEYLVTINNVIYKVSLIDEKNVTVNDVAYAIDFKKVNDDVYKLSMTNLSYEVEFSDFITKKSPITSIDLSSKLNIKVNGLLMQAIIDDQRSLVAQSWLRRKPHISKPSTLRAPMPGLITKILVQQGEIVPRGGVFLVLEAMKMENEIRALQKCKIEFVSVRPGATVERNEELLKIIEI